MHYMLGRQCYILGSGVSLVMGPEIWVAIGFVRSLSQLIEEKEMYVYC